MPQIINTNISSLNAQRNLNTTQRANETALQRLSSGLRINSSRDDAAGLAISTRFEAQVRGLGVAIRNASDGVSLAQTAEGAFGAMTNILLRVRDLSLQAINAPNSDVDRDALNAEVVQLKEELGRIADQTNFNGTKLLDGTFTEVAFQIGANRGEEITFGISQATIDTLGTAVTAGLSSVGSGSEGGAALSGGDLLINGVAVPPSSATDDNLSTVSKNQSAIAKAAAINTVADLTGIEAVVNSLTVEGASFTNTTATASFAINGATIALAISSTNSVDSNLNLVVERINEKSDLTGVVAGYNGISSAGITLTSEDGRNITIAAASAGGDATQFGLAVNNGSTGVTYTGSYTLISQDGRDIVIDTSNNIDNAGLEIGTYSGVNSGVVGDNVGSGAFATGDLVVNGVPVPATQSSFDTASVVDNASSAIAKAVAINQITEDTGVTATANSNVVIGGAFVTGSTGGSLDINGVTISLSYASTANAGDIQVAVVESINRESGRTGVRAEAFGSSFRLVADDGRNIQIQNSSTASDAGFGTTFNVTGTTANATFYGSISLAAAGTLTLSSQTGNTERSGFPIGEYGGGIDGQLLRDVDISTVKGAQEALAAVDNALQFISVQRANLGAIQNRFESTITNQAIARENLSAANSRIKDADFATETAELSRTQTLQQAGLSILAQANAQPQQVLQLLQG